MQNDMVQLSIIFLAIVFVAVSNGQENRSVKVGSPSYFTNNSFSLFRFIGHGRSIGKNGLSWWKMV